MATRKSKHNRFRRKNSNSAHASHFFVHLCRFCTTATWKYLILHFMEDGTSDDEILFLFLNLDRDPRISAPGVFALFWSSKWAGIIAIKTGRTQIHFLCDVFTYLHCHRVIMFPNRWSGTQSTSFPEHLFFPWLRGCYAVVIFCLVWDQRLE